MTKLSEKIKAQLPAHEGITKAMSMRTLQDWAKDAEHLEGGGWIPCDAGPIPERVDFQVANADGVGLECHQFIGGAWYPSVSGPASGLNAITHYRPLPPNP